MLVVPMPPEPEKEGSPGVFTQPPSLVETGAFAPFENAPDAVLVLDSGARVLEANGAACELYGCNRSQFIGRVLADAAGTDPVPGYVARATAGEVCRGVIVSHRRHDGTVLRVEVSAVAVEHPGCRSVLTIHRDVTNRELTEERLRQTAKMEAVGQLVGGVAHDFNNLLTVINGYADVLGESMPPEDPMAGVIAEIRAAGTRAADLTRQLLAFSRKQILRPQLVHLGRLVENLRKMLGRLIGEDIRLVTLTDPDLAVVRADPGQLEQIILNLAVNARDAMPKGGTLTIECRNCVDCTPRHIRLTVSDTGVGMTDEVKARIFEPFFTTKGPGKGTGLGLATVFGIVQQSGGRIQVQSRPGAGTAFHIDLPTTGSIVESLPTSAMTTAPSRGSETVLLVEDEGAVRMMALHALQMNGYAVLDAEDGEQALRVVQSFGVPIRLLVTDVVMPGLGGRELADRLQTAQPKLRVLYMSGYTSDEIVRRGVEADRVHFLQKPFTPGTLTRKVSEILDAPE